jgi:hypothetical protein
VKIAKIIISIALKIRMFITLLIKIRNIGRGLNIKDVPISFLKKNRLYWNSIDSFHNTQWAKVYYSINKNADPKYISETTYYSEVEPRLNNIHFSEAYSDKNCYHKIIPTSLLPSIYLRCIDGSFYSQDYKVIKQEEFEKNINNIEYIVIKKAIETGGGRNVSILKKNETKFKYLFKSRKIFDDLKRKYGRNFIVQEYIYQHSFFQQFNPSSVNTIRLFSYRSVMTNEIQLLHAVLRIGKKGALVDNQAAGGISCGINIDSGVLNDFAVNKYGNIFKESNNIEFKSLKIPFFKNLKLVAIDIAREYKYHRLLGFDFTINKENKIKLIEVNNKNNEINFYQMNNGSLFGNFSDEIIDYCKNSPKHISLDFSIK